ncbi:unnamed protein product [Cylicocyclus nassatus]|uniref:CKK domain-containing protein n=1 Tax=Cylicocyclus nassatus TaxID=53992 RepID=A0AA36HF57_CYLNA|nr:unnamed protein product [Cylicocyclus nassatus]
MIYSVYCGPAPSAFDFDVEEPSTTLALMGIFTACWGCRKRNPANANPQQSAGNQDRGVRSTGQIFSLTEAKPRPLRRMTVPSPFSESVVSEFDEMEMVLPQYPTNFSRKGTVEDEEAKKTDPQMAPASARAGYGTLPRSVNAQFYNCAQPQGHYAQPQQLRACLSDGMLNYLVPGHAPSYGEYPTGLLQFPMQPPPGYTLDPYSSDPGLYMQKQLQQLNYPMSAHGVTGFSLHQPSTVGISMMTPPASAYSSVQAMPPSLDQHSSSPSYTLQQPPQPTQLMSTAGMMSAQHQQQLYQQQYAPYQGTPQLENQPPLEYESHEGASTFRLHSKDASSSRIDPPLEINRNLTNGGMTYQKDQVQRQSPCPVGAGPRRSRDSREGEAVAPEPERVRVQDSETTVASPQPSASRDPSNNTSGASTEEKATVPPGVTFEVTDDQAAEDFDKIAEQRRQAKRAALLTKMMMRKEENKRKVDQGKQRNAEKRLAEIARRMAEQRKLEKELQRQKILDDFRRRKMGEELGVKFRSNSARSCRGHSQPPFVRTKSQMSESAMGADRKRGEEGRPPRARSQSAVDRRNSVASLQEPTHKLFAKAALKSNRGLIINALQYSVFPGPVDDLTRMKTMTDLAASDAKHFLILFRDYKYRGLYSWDQISDTAIKISGQGPPKCSESIMKLMFKYDSGAKNFSQIPTKHLGATIDGFCIQDRFWQMPKTPCSSAASHRID